MCANNRPQWAQPKPKPKTQLPKGQTWVVCGKCAGTGLYVMEVRNGQPWSATGLQCWSCGGHGWKTRKPKRKRCPKCGFLHHIDEDGCFEPHSYLTQVGDHFEQVLCQ